MSRKVTRRGIQFGPEQEEVLARIRELLAEQTGGLADDRVSVIVHKAMEVYCRQLERQMGKR